MFFLTAKNKIYYTMLLYYIMMTSFYHQIRELKYV